MSSELECGHPASDRLAMKGSVDLSAADNLASEKDRSLAQAAADSVAQREGAASCVQRAEELHVLPEVVHQYMWDLAKFTDQKAGFNFAIGSALIGYLMNKGAANILHAHSGPLSIASFFGICALVLLVASCVLCVATVVPRLGASLPDGCIYWKDVLAHGVESDYVARVLALTKRESRVEILRHAYILSRIVNEKNRALMWAFGSGAIGFLLGLCFLFCS